MKLINFQLVLLFVLVVIQGCNKPSIKYGNEIYFIPDGIQTRWTSFENRTGEKGKGGMENQGAKGHAYDRIPAGQSVVLLDVKGAGVIRRIWATMGQQEPEILRGLRLDMYWDGEGKPAVSVPWGDFFGVGLGKHLTNETEYFSNPEGRSFNSFIPMPFKKSAKIVVTNELDRDMKWLFYDINYTVSSEPNEDALYFHAYWSRDTATVPGEDFEILPKVEGKGRYIGCNMGVVEDKANGDSWFGEGEAKMYIDGDTDYPTLVGTGTEDYIGTAWGQGVFNHRYQGSLIADKEKGEWTFYRYHVADPVYFHKDFKATIQQLGGHGRDQVRELVHNGVNIIPTSVQNGAGPTEIFVDMYEDSISIDDPELTDGWTLFYRSDDVSATAYFYMDKPSSNLPNLAAVEERICRMDSIDSNPPF